MSTLCRIGEQKDYNIPVELQSTDYIKSIQKYLKIKNLINIAKDCVFKEKKHIRVVAQIHNIPYSILQEKISIMNLFELYLIKKSKYEAAVKSVLLEKKLITFAATTHDINFAILLEEIVQFSNSQQKMYIFDKPVNPVMDTFTYNEELIVLKIVELWKTNNNPLCSCEICFMEKLMIVAYNFAQKNNLKYPSRWDIDKRASIGWLIAFDMLHSELISNLASHNECLRFPVFKSRPDSPIFPYYEYMNICRREKKRMYSRRCTAAYI